MPARPRSSQPFLLRAPALLALAFAASTAHAQVTSLTVVKTADAAIVSAGDQVGFTIDVYNSGSQIASGVGLTDNLPGGLTWFDDSTSCTISNGTLSCSFGNLPPGGPTSVHVTSTSNAASCGVLLNVAVASAANAAQAPGVASITVNCPDLEVRSTADSTPFHAGRPIGLVLSVLNKGAGTAKGPQLTAHLPKENGLVWSESPPSGVNACVLTSESTAFLFRCFPSEMKAGESFSVHLTTPTQPNSFFGDATVGPFDAAVTANNDAAAGDQFDSLELPVRYTGDVDGNGVVSVTDVFALINFLFAGGPPPA
jgi:uncharacterized repeat protein (TIGR01451 family)